jgi:hypothetical protein
VTGKLTPAEDGRFGAYYRFEIRRSASVCSRSAMRSSTGFRTTNGQGIAASIRDQLHLPPPGHARERASERETNATASEQDHFTIDVVLGRS